jgi:cytosine/adenosine deaminase-related metal-dependent hydrolase
MDKEIIFKADYVVPLTDSPIKDAALYIRGNKIINCDKFVNINPANKKIIDLKNAVILPGFVNTHVHLEYSKLKEKICFDNSFVGWIMELIKAKEAWNDLDYTESVEIGIKELIRSGTTTVAEVSNSGLSFELLKNSRLRGIVFKEVIGFKDIDSIFLQLKEYLNQLQPTELIEYGICAHAPYSVSSKLIIALHKFSQVNNLFLMMHISESEEELEFLMGKNNKFIDLLKSRDVWDESWVPPKLTPIKYLNSLGVLNSKIIGVHMNYLSSEEIELISKAKISIIHCPKSHKFFQRTDYPIKFLLEKGINIALGTDSLASNSSLSMLEEIKELRRRYKELSSQGILKMAILNGAKALGLEDRIGSLTKGKYADFIGLRLPKDFNGNIYDFIVEEAEEVIINVVNGEILFKSEII